MSMKRWLGLDKSVKAVRSRRSRSMLSKRRMLLEALESREVFAAFVAGNLLVERIGNGNTIGSAAFPVSVQEYLVTGGSPVQTLDFTGTNLVTDSGSATSNGYLNSYNGLLAVPGYNSATGTASVASQNSKVGTIVAVDTSIASRTLFPTGGVAGNPISPFSGNNFRSMIATGNNTFYASGTSSGAPNTGGVWYFNGTSFTQLNTTATNTRNLEIYNNQLYVSTGSGTAGIVAIGSGLPTSSSQTATNLISTGTGSSPYGFVLFDTDSNGAVDLAYIADDRTAAGGGLQKWTLNAGAWTQSWALLVNASNALSATAAAGYAGLRGLTGSYENGVATLYATSATESSNNRLLSIVDSGTTPTSATTVALAGANYVFRGVDFSPVSPDVAPPTITALSPVDGATGVAIGTNLVATFNETIAKGTGDILIKRSSDDSIAFTLDVAGSAVSVSGATLTIDPPSDLQNGVSYYIQIPATAIRDVANNFFSGISDTTTWNFETVSLGDTVPPTITSLSPADNATDVAISSDLVVTFNEEVVKGTGNILVKRTLDDSVVQTIDVASGLVTVSGNQVTINPALDLANSVGYYIEIPATAFSDASNNFYVGTTDKETWNFTTVADTTPPTVVSIDDGDADNVVLTNVLLTYTIVFSEDMDGATVTAGDFDNAGSASVVFGQITETSAGVFTVQVTPTTAGTLVLRIAEGAEIRDVAGNLLSVPVVDNDTLTVNDPDVTPPTVVSIADDRSGAAINANFSIVYTITFSEDVLLSTVNATDFDNAGTASISIGAIQEPTPGVITVVVTPTSAGTLQLRIPEGATILDLASNALVPPVLDDTTITVNPVTSLTAGDIAFTGIQTDDPDSFSFVLLKDVVDGTQIRFTDNRWSNAGVLAANETTLILTFANNGAGWSAGTHFVNTNGGASPAFRVVGTQNSAGLVTGTINGLATSGDSLLAYQGNSAPTDGNSTAWIAGINTRNWSSGATNNESELPTALTLGVNAIALSNTATDVDNGAFIAPNFVGSVAEIRSVLNEVSNWTTSNTLGPISPTNFNIVNVSSEIFLSEITFDPVPEVDTGEEYIELRGQPNTYLPGTAYLLLLEGDSEDGPGGIDHRFYLGGMQFGSNGFLVLRQFGSTYTTDGQATVVTATSQGWGAAWSSRATDIENGSVTAIVVLSVAAPVVDSDVDSNNDGELDGAAANWVIRDRIGNIDGGATDTAYGVLNTSGNGSGLVPAGSTLINLGGYHPDYMARNGLSTGYSLVNNENTDWVVGELEGQMPTVSLATGGFSRPSAYGGSPLDDIGALNSFSVGNAAPTDITLSSSQIAENSGANALVGTLSTSDPDSGDTFTYTLVAGTGDADNGAFSIDSSSLRANNSFDFETKSSYAIRIRSTDQGGYFIEKAFTISVTDINESPTITSNGGGDNASVTIDENTTAVTTVIAVDPDSGASLAYSIQGGADRALFQINANSGVLTFISAPDFETPLDANTDNVYEVLVQVSDGSLTDAQFISVTVSDVQDSQNTPPTITSNGGGDNASLAVEENTTAVTTVTADDPDSGQTLTFSISGVDASLFTIGSASGVLVFTSSPNFEAPADSNGDNVYLVTVTVSDGFGGSDAQNLAITVTDVNEAPVITSNGGGARASVSVPENTTSVTTVTATDPDAGASMVYSISGGADAAFFAINSSSGVLEFLAAPNFENRLDSDANNVYDVTVQVTDGTNVDTQAIEVTVTNVNESPSQLINRTLVVQAGQTVQLGAALLAFSDPELAVLTYSVTSAPAGTLRKNNVAITTFTSTDLSASSSLGNAIRYTAPEKVDNDSFTVSVTDGTNTIAGVVVSIKIVEATAPANFAGSYSQGFDDLLPLPVPGDRQTLPMAQVLPQGWLIAESGSNAEHSIQIDNGASTTGDSFLFGATLSNERGLGSFSSGSLSSQYGVFLVNTTGSTVNSLAVSYTGEQWKNGVSATAVLNKLTFAYSTSATTINANTGYTSVPALDFTAPIGGTVGGDVTLNGNLPENQKNISGSITGLSWAPGAALYLRWTDINDAGNDDALAIDNLVITATNYAPTITSNGGGNSASVEVVENSTAVTTVTVLDPDSGQTLSYSLSGTDANKFAITTSGVLTFATAPDFENPLDANSDNQYEVTVTVDDGNGGFDSQALLVTVTNTNEVPTDISLSSNSLAENAGANAVIGLFATSDSDAGSTFTYSLVEGTGDGDNGAFNIEGSSLRANQSFDFETKSSYTIRVRSTDQGGLFVEKAFNISVTDENEAPTDINLSSVDFEENAGVNAVVGAFTTVDPDAGNSFTYIFVEGTGDTDNSAFNLDGSNLRANASFDFESKSSYTVRVRSTDQSGMFIEKAFTISVLNVNESPTGIQLATIDFEENAGANALVGGFSTTDPDAGDTFTYSLVTGSGDADNAAFSIDGSSLRAVSSFDFETKSSYTIRVRSTDQGGLFTEKAFTISVLNVNESPTDIQLATIDFEENAGANALVGGFSTTDPDAGETFTYSLVTGSGDADNAAFSIDGSNLRAVSSFDFETKSSYTIRVRSTDQGGLFTEKAFTISVLNVNEGPTDIALSSNSIAENAGANATVGALSTVDPDSGNTFTYTLVAGTGDADNNAFNIDGNNLRANASFDFETKSSYTVRVRSTDQGGLFTEKAFTISVTDVPEGVLINGTSGPDTILVTYLGDGTTHTWSVKINAAATFNATGNLIVDGLAGTDTLQVIGRATNDVYVQEASRLTLNGAIVQFPRIENLRSVAGLGDDTMRVLEPIVAGVVPSYDGGGGVDILEAVSGANTWNVTGAGIGNLNGSFSFLGVESLRGGTGDDQFVFGASGALTSRVLGGDGSDTISFAAKTTAQSVNLQLNTASSTGGFGGIESFIGGSSATLLDALTGANSSTAWRIHGANTGTLFSTPTGAVNFSGFESVTGGTAEDVFEISSGGSLTGTLTGGTATGVIDRMDLSNKPTALDFRLDATTSRIPGVINGNYTGVEIVSGNNVLGSRVTRVNNIATAWSVNAAGEIAVVGVTYIGVGAIVGNAGALADTLTGPSVGSIWTIDSAGGGSLAIPGAKVTFAGIENLTGGTNVDSFVFTDAGSVSGVINGGTATGVVDQVDLSAKTTALDFRLSATTSVVPGSIAGNYTGFERVLGNSVAGTKITRVNNIATNWVVNTLGQILVSNVTYSGVGAIAGNTQALADTLSGPAVDSTWTITGANSGALAIPAATISFTSMENLTGNTALDHFEIQPSGAISGAVNGGTGTGLNSLSYAQWSTGVTVNLAVTTVANATGIAGLTSNIQMVTGGSGNDILTGQAAKSTILVGLGGNDRLVGGSQRDILLGGLGADTVLGGNGDDLMVSGTTSYDTNREALYKIYAEWISARTFAQRTANIWGNGTTPRANENYFFNSDPTDGITDTVFADSDIDSLTGGLNQDWFFASLNDTDDFGGTGATPDRRDR